MTLTFQTRDHTNLVIPTTFEPMNFPAGEAHLKIVANQDCGSDVVEIARVYGMSHNDLFMLGMWADACRRRGSRMILLMPYLPGARADHSDFVPLGAEVYSRFIAMLGIDDLVILDPHSPVMPSILTHLMKREPHVIDGTQLVAKHVVPKGCYTGIIAPDKGAVARASAAAEAAGLPLYKAEKKRDPDTGKLSGFTCEPLPGEGRFLVVDDICDGGGTFMGLAAAIADANIIGDEHPAELTRRWKDRLGLYVSHGVFSGNASALSRHFGEVWTTDSMQTADWHRNLAEMVADGLDNGDILIPEVITLEDSFEDTIEQIITSVPR